MGKEVSKICLKNAPNSCATRCVILENEFTSSPTKRENKISPR